MKETLLIDKLANTSKFKKLQDLGIKLFENQRRFDLLSVYEELIDEMVWSKLFAYLLDSTKNHGLDQIAFRNLLEQIPQLKSFSKLLPTAENTQTISIKEWKAEKNRRIDILIKLIDKNGVPKGIVGIENKVESGEQNNQIRDYQKSIISNFPKIPKIILYLTPDGRKSKTSDESTECICYNISYNVILKICEHIIPNYNGQAKIFLEALKNHIMKLTGSQLIDDEASKLIKDLYKNDEYRQAIKLIQQYSPNTKRVFDELFISLKKSKKLPFKIDNIKVHYFPTTSSNPYEFKLYITELTEIGKNKGFHGIYMLSCESSNPDIDDFFILRLTVGFVNKKFKDLASRQQLRNKTTNAFSFKKNSIGDDKHWGPWTSVWTGNSYKLVDMGDRDVEGLKKLLINGIKDTYEEYKLGLKKLTRIRL